MTDQQKETILTAACDICHYPHFLTQEQLDAVCVVCPVEHALNTATAEEAPHE